MTTNGQQDLPLKPNTDKFIDDMFEHAQELLVVLRRDGRDDKIKDRIVCLKYLEEVTKTYFVLKKVISDDDSADAAGSSVRKYATAFSKDATGSGTPRKRGRKPAAFAAVTADTGRDDFEDDGDTAA